MSNIVDILNQYSIRKEKRSEAFEKAQETSIRNKMNFVQALLSGDSPNEGLPMSIVYLREKYYSMVKDYKGSFVSFPAKINKRGVALWTRVEKAREQSGCSPDRFLTAQFKWFDKAFGKVPSVEQLTTEAAVDRAREYGGEDNSRVLGN